ncbi:RsbR, positive regulator of sigma-B [Chondromyces apiculatus DSM 436]|uniref:RsbR, positive regulator of sigma-B n=1 Tax=Chondromyces apiculatus DSM 436 TaxID=1192034 RepID=A0A017TI07_9BACT|nr:RsbR, positive regulator of sigma-B [Chondromyces apiculatus DSM 436]
MELASPMCEILIETFPMMVGVPRDMLGGMCVDGFRAYVAALRAPSFEALRKFVVTSNEGLVMIGCAPEQARDSLLRGRRLILGLAMTLLEEGVPSAREGILRLVEAYGVGLEATIESIHAGGRSDLEVSGRLLRTFAEVCPEAMAISVRDNSLSLVNEAFEALLGQEVPTGWLFTSLVVPEDEAQWREASAELSTARSWRGRLRFAGAGGRVIPTDVTAFQVDTESGGKAYCWLVRDVSELLQAEEERLRLQAEVIAAQDQAIRELMTPLLPLAEGVVAMPIVGSIDPARSERILDVLLSGIAARGAQVAILDITGVNVVDTQVAEGLLRAARAARLLGTEVILTGLRAAVAQTLVSLDVHLDELTTCGTLQEGVARALRRARARGNG